MNWLQLLEMMLTLQQQLPRRSLLTLLLLKITAMRLPLTRSMSMLTKRISSYGLLIMQLTIADETQQPARSIQLKDWHNFWSSCSYRSLTQPRLGSHQHRQVTLQRTMPRLVSHQHKQVRLQRTRPRLVQNGELFKALSRIRRI